MLQRARATLGSTGSRRSLDEDDRRVLARFVDAWHRRDIPGLAELLREDVELRMPPEAMEFFGREDVLAFFVTVPADGAFETIQLVQTRANGRPAVVAFHPDGSGGWFPYGIMVFDIDGDGIRTITGFPTAMERPLLASAFDVAPRS